MGQLITLFRILIHCPFALYQMTCLMLCQHCVMIEIIRNYCFRAIAASFSAPSRLLASARKHPLWQYRPSCTSDIWAKSLFFPPHFEGSSLRYINLHLPVGILLTPHVLLCVGNISIRRLLQSRIIA